MENILDKAGSWEDEVRRREEVREEMRCVEA